MESLPVQEQSSFAEGRPLFLSPSCCSSAALASLRLLDLNSHHPPPTRDGSQSGRGSRPLPLVQPTAPRRSAAKTGSVEGGGGFLAQGRDGDSSPIIPSSRQAAADGSWSPHQGRSGNLCPAKSGRAAGQMCHEPEERTMELAVPSGRL